MKGVSLVIDWMICLVTGLDGSKVIDDEFIHGAGGELPRLVLVILGQEEDVALLQLLAVVVVVGENVYFVQLHGEKVLELFVVLPRVQEKLVKTYLGECSRKC